MNAATNFARELKQAYDIIVPTVNTPVRLLSGGNLGRVILSREILVSGLREFLAEVRVSVPVSRLAKWKTTLQLVAVGFLVLGDAGDAIVPVVTPIGLFLLWLSAMLTLYTGWDYFRAGLRHLID